MAVQRLRDILNNQKYSKGSNSLKTRDIFDERVKYNKKHGFKENSIDLQNQRSLYGRLDFQQNLIYPNMGEIGQLATLTLILPVVEILW